MSCRHGGSLPRAHRGSLRGNQDNENESSLVTTGTKKRGSRLFPQVDDSPYEWDSILTGLDHFAKDGWDGLEFGLHFVPCAGVIRALDLKQGRDHVQDQILDNIKRAAESFPWSCGEGAKFTSEGAKSPLVPASFPGAQCYDRRLDFDL